MNPNDLQSFLLWLVPLLAITGVVGGVLAGLLGVGGGIVIVPVLYHVFSYLGIDEAIRMHLAVGTSLATIIPTSIRSVRAHWKRNSFDAELFKAWAPGVFVGVLIGTWLASIATFSALTSVFAVVAMIVAIHMGFGRKDRVVSTRPPEGVIRSALTTFIGAISAMMGIGGGTLSVPIMTLYGVPIHRAVGTAAGLGIVIAIPGVIGFMISGWNAAGLPPASVGYVNWLGFLLIVPATVLAVPLGARLAHSLDPQPLRRVFAAFLALTAGRMFWDVFSL
ncbi:MAG: sulfite exporter TauE/SafE family protein [Gammaproteobacteria bacterium]